MRTRPFTIFVLFISIILFTTRISAQNYLPTAIEGSHRIVAMFYQDPVFVPIPEIVDQWDYYCSGDTIYEGNTYKKLYKRDIQIYSYPYHPVSEYHLVALIRDDIDERKVYACQIDGWGSFICDFNPEIVLYDFSVEEGDVISVCLSEMESNEIYSVDEGVMYGEDTRFFDLGMYYYMEGIGSSCGFLEPLTVVLKNSKDIYFNELYDYCSGDGCSIFTETKEIELKNLHIFPQPASTNLYFQIPFNHQLGELFIYNSTGQLIQNTTVSNNNDFFTLDMSHYNSGIYFYKYILNDQVFSGKIVKN